MSESNPLRPIDIGAMVLLGAIWGGSFLFMRIAVKDFGAIPLIQVRLTVAAVLLLCVLVIQGKLKLLLVRPSNMFVVGLLNSAIPYPLFAFGTKSLEAGFASILNATSPFFSALIALLVFRQGMAVSKWMGLLAGFVGVFVLSAFNKAIDGSALGIAACLFAAFLYAVAAHYSKRNLVGTDPMVTATASMISASLCLAPLSVYLWPSQSPSRDSWLAAIALGILCTGAALAIYFHLIQVIGATRSVSVAYLIPLFGVLWGCLFLGESLTVSILCGGTLILAGLFFVSRSVTPAQAISDD